ncbi:MAG TPA: ABC transporter permease [Candidatus Rubrimentiphilum sp.]|nr:ABC transporter permease [Candidatus Rubrimentiphilum sp.]
MALAAPINQPVVQEDAEVFSKVTAWKRFRRHKLAMAGVVVLAIMVLAAVFAWKLAPFDPNFIDEVHWQGNPVPPCFVNAAQCGGHFLGLDENGRDLLSRLMFGAQISLTVAVSAVIMELVLGTLLGALAGYYGTVTLSWKRFSWGLAIMLLWLALVTGAGAVAGYLIARYFPLQTGGGLTQLIILTLLGAKIAFDIVKNIPPKPPARIVAVTVAGAAIGCLAALLLPGKPLALDVMIIVGVLYGGLVGFQFGLGIQRVDHVIMRVTDVFLSIPLLPLLLVLTGIVAASSTKAALSFETIVLIIGGLSWPSVARLVRATYLSLREREYAEAARAVGNSDLRIMLRHLLPNAMAPITVQATLDVANVIILESVLSFLGFGIQPPTASWGSMLANAEANLQDQWWVAVFPGLCILVTVLAINFIGDGLRDALDPNAIR